MKIYNVVIAILLVSFMTNCGSNSENNNNLFTIKFEENKSNYSIAESVSVSLTNKQNLAIDSIIYFLETSRLMSLTNNSTARINLTNQTLGNKTLSAKIYSDGNLFNASSDITILSNITPKLYGYKVIETYPHDIEAYTQGLEFNNDTLYESTGIYNESSLRKTNYKTGEVYKKINLAKQYFGEGLTILNQKIYQLTWKGKTGFIYELESMERKGTFVYGVSQEGWGLCNDGKNIYKSDGTQKIWKLHSETLAEENYIEVYTNKSKIDSVNELEWVEGKIYANIYEKDAIAIVNPLNGAVEGVINLKGLKDQVSQHDELNVLNGIAYKGEPNVLYITGKNWDKLFKIEVITN